MREQLKENIIAKVSFLKLLKRKNPHEYFHKPAAY